jgi:Ca2+-binding EF-hand superfamily protein
MSAEDIEEIFKKIDSNGDGFLSNDEVTDYFMADYASVLPLFASLKTSMDSVSESLSLIREAVDGHDYLDLFRHKVLLNLYLSEVKCTYDAVNGAAQYVDQKSRDLR